MRIPVPPTSDLCTLQFNTSCSSIIIELDYRVPVLIVPDILLS